MSRFIDGRRVLVTGEASGIGHAIGERFVAGGALAASMTGGAQPIDGRISTVLT